MHTMYVACGSAAGTYAYALAAPGFVRGSGLSLEQYGPPLPNPGHQEYSMCRASIYTLTTTPGEAAASLVSNLSGYDGRHMRFTRYMSEGSQRLMALLIDTHLATHPDGVVVVGNYTPRGRKRRAVRGLRQSRFLTLSVDGKRCLHAWDVFYRGEQFKVTRQGITVRCQCKGTGRVHPRTSVVWETPA